MISLTVLISSFALAASPFAPSQAHAQSRANAVLPGDPPQDMGLPDLPAPFIVIERSMRPRGQYQVRIEEHVIIRIAPSPPAIREQMLSNLPRRDMETRYQEVKLDSCIPIRGIAGVAPVQPNRLLLFMRDHRVLSAALERTCDAQAFYSGFYVERSADGMLCSGRDQLQSRAGTTCEVSQFNRLVAIKN